MRLAFCSYLASKQNRCAMEAEKELGAVVWAILSSLPDVNGVAALLAPRPACKSFTFLPRAAATLLGSI